MDVDAIVSLKQKIEAERKNGAKLRAENMELKDDLDNFTAEMRKIEEKRSVITASNENLTLRLQENRQECEEMRCIMAEDSGFEEEKRDQELRLKLKNAEIERILLVEKVKRMQNEKKRINERIRILQNTPGKPQPLPSHPKNEGSASHLTFSKPFYQASSRFEQTHRLSPKEPPLANRRKFQISLNFARFVLCEQDLAEYMGTEAAVDKTYDLSYLMDSAEQKSEPNVVLEPFSYRQ